MSSNIDEVLKVHPNAEWDWYKLEDGRYLAIVDTGDTGRPIAFAIHKSMMAAKEKAWSKAAFNVATYDKETRNG